MPVHEGHTLSEPCLHRAELTQLEWAEHEAEWMRLTTEKSLAQVEPVKSRRSDGRGGSVGAGINAAARELDLERTAIGIASVYRILAQHRTAG